MSLLKLAISQTTQVAAQASVMDGEANGITARGGCGDDCIMLNGNYNVFDGGCGNDMFAMMGNYNTLFDNGGENTVVAYGDHNNMFMQNGTQDITSIGSDNNINAGNGSHMILFGGDRNDVSFGNGNTTCYFFGADNMIVGGNGNHEVKTLDWVVNEDNNKDYYEFAYLLDNYGTVTDNTKSVVEDVEYSQTNEATESVGVGSAGFNKNVPEIATKTPTTAELVEQLSEAEKAIAEKANLAEKTADGRPRYVFAIGSNDNHVHLYDRNNENKCVVELDTGAGNYILYENGSVPNTTSEGAATYVAYQEINGDATATSGKYEDLLKFGQKIYVTETTSGTKTTITGTKDYDYSDVNNTIKLGDGNSTVRYTGSGQITYGDKVCDGSDLDTDVVQRGGLQMDVSDVKWDLSTDYLYSLSEHLEGRTWGSIDSKAQTGSPLIVDFNKDGKVSAKAGMGVDIDNNGKADGAATSGDKMLAMSDMNGNAKIDGTEVFGNNTVDPFTGKKINAANGFEALKAVAKSAEKETGVKCLNNGQVDLQALKAALARINIVLGFISDENVTELEDLAHVKAIDVENYAQQQETGDVQNNQLGSYTDTQGNKFRTNDVWFKLS